MDLNELIKNPEQIKNLIQVLQNLLPETQNIKEIAETKNDEQEEFTTPLVTRGSKRKTKQTKNKFLDMPEKDMHKDDIVVDKKLSKFPPVARTRQFELVDVICRVCGRKESVSPALIVEGVDRYKCNNCSTSAG
jgi:hypothetical protein